MVEFLRPAQLEPKSSMETASKPSSQGDIAPNESLVQSDPHIQVADPNGSSEPSASAGLNGWTGTRDHHKVSSSSSDTQVDEVADAEVKNPITNSSASGIEDDPSQSSTAPIHTGPPSSPRTAPGFRDAKIAFAVDISGSTWGEAWRQRLEPFVRFLLSSQVPPDRKSRFYHGVTSRIPQQGCSISTSWIPTAAQGQALSSMTRNAAMLYKSLLSGF